MRSLCAGLLLAALHVHSQGRVPDSLAAGPFRTLLVKDAQVVQARPLRGVHPRYRELRCVMVVHAPPEQVLSILARTELSPRWMARCVEAKDIGARSPGGWTVRYVYDLPWPLRDRDGVLHFQKHQEPSGALRLFFGSLPDVVPVLPGLDRDKGLQGMWELIPRGEEDTCVVYYVSSKEDLGIPLWMTDPVVLPILANSLQALAGLVLEMQPTR